MDELIGRSGETGRVGGGEVLRALRRHRGDEGASAVEFALVAPVLIMLVFGIIAFGFLLAQQLSLGNASRQAARFGVVNSRTCGDIVTEAQNDASTLNMNGANARVTISRTGTTPNPCGNGFVSKTNSTPACQGSDIDSQLSVRVEYDSQLVIPLILNNKTFTIVSTGTFRCEYQ